MKTVQKLLKGLIGLLCVLLCTMPSFADNVVFSGAPEGTTVTVIDDAGKVTTSALKLNTSYPDSAIITLVNRGRIVVQIEGSDTRSIIIGDIKASFTLAGSTNDDGILVNPSENSSTVILLGSFTDDDDSTTLNIVMQEQHVLGPRRDAVPTTTTPAPSITPATVESDAPETPADVVTTANTYNP